MHSIKNSSLYHTNLSVKNEVTKKWTINVIYLDLSYKKNLLERLTFRENTKKLIKLVLKKKRPVSHFYLFLS